MVEDIRVVQVVGNLPGGQMVDKTSQLLMLFLNQLMLYLCDLEKIKLLDSRFPRQWMTLG
jgi:hypothetical protein